MISSRLTGGFLYERNILNMDPKRLEEQLGFALEIDKEKNIFRQTYISDMIRKENDAEHAWHMAVMAYLLKEYSNENIDIARTMIMCLIHDIVEIDAGDTFAYDDKGKETQKEREEKAADRIFGLLPDDQRDELRAIFEEFEAQETPEARFARAMDNLQPLMLNDSNNGYSWKEHGVRAEQAMKRHEGTKAGSEILYRKCVELIDKNKEAGNLL